MLIRFAQLLPVQLSSIKQFFKSIRQADLKSSIFILKS